MMALLLARAIMLRVDHFRWGQTLLELRQTALSAPHERTRERFLAVYEVACGSNATEVAALTGRNHQTVQEWVKRYNTEGPKALVYQRSGGRSPLLIDLAVNNFEPT